MFDDFDDFDFDFDAFSLQEDAISSKVKSRYIKPPLTKLLGENILLYRKAEDFAKSFNIKKNENVYAIVNGSFIFGDFLTSLIVNNGWRCKRLLISTLSLNAENVDTLKTLLEIGAVDFLDLIVSDYFYSHERNGLIPYIYEQLDIDNKFQLAAAATHCKIYQFETYNGGFVVMHGSANMRSSSNIEQIMISESEELYRFNESVFDKVLNRYATINKSIRGNKLWQAVEEAVNLKT